MAVSHTSLLTEVYEKRGEKGAREVVMQTLWEAEGRLAVAAEKLDMTRAVLHYHLRKLGLVGFPERVREEVAKRFPARKVRKRGVSGIMGR